jgi:mono/diheme cytochrome c family protein
MRSSLTWLVLTVMTVATARADEQPVPLKEAPGRAVVEHNCASCHSLDYLRTNSPFLDRRGWQAEITKMTNVFGAPIAPEDANAIADYLAKNCGIGG